MTAKELVNKELVKSYISEFKGRYLTLEKLKSMQNGLDFHLFGHWNNLHIDNNFVCHSYHNGETGKNENMFSKISFPDLDNIVFVKWKDTFILFKSYKKSYRAIYVNNELSPLSSVEKEHKFLFENGISVTRRAMFFDKNMMLEFKNVDVFK